LKSLAVALLISLAAPLNVCWAIQTEKHAKTMVKSPVIHVSDEQCLATTIWRESGNQSFRGQMLVAAVVVNRMKHHKMTACQVVRQRGQWSWFKGEHSLALTQQSKMYLGMARQILLDVKHGKFVNYAGKHNIMWFHSKQVSPRWKKSVKMVVAEGNHYFYAKRS